MSTIADLSQCACELNQRVTELESVVVPSGANPTAQIGLTAVNGVASTFMRSDAAPAIDPSILPLGDVTAASSFGTDNRIIRSDGTGKGVQASTWEMNDTGQTGVGIPVNSAVRLALSQTGVAPTALRVNASGSTGDAIGLLAEAASSLTSTATAGKFTSNGFGRNVAVLIHAGTLDFVTVSSVPPSPPAGTVSFYVKTSDGRLYQKTSDGTETAVTN